MTIALPTSLHVDHLLPSLCPSEELNGIKLCDDGFGDSPACIQLSRTLSMSMVHGTGAETKRVSQRALDDLGLTTRQAWDTAALNLQRRALTQQGLRFFTRPAEQSLSGAEGSLEVRVHRCTVSSWLAHPQTFSIMDSHLRRLTHATARQTLYYLVPDPATVVALHDSPLKRVRHWSRRINEQRRLRGAVLAPEPLLWANGFPLEA